MIDKLFVENIPTKPEGSLDTIEIFSDYIIVLSMENCPYCEILHKDYISKTNKKYTVITYKSRDKTFSFDTNFIDIPTKERENIIDEVDKFLKGPSTFPTIIHNKKVTRGLVDKSILNKIF
jgi:glutaredoxin